MALLLLGLWLQNAEFSLKLHQPLRQDQVVGGQLRGIRRLHRIGCRVMWSLGEEAVVSEVNRRAKRGVRLVGRISHQERRAGAATSSHE